MPRYVVGIDLGTTNSALAYIDLADKPKALPKIRSFAVPQLIGPAELGEESLLPSFLYLPGEYDLPAGATALPWHPTAKEVVGRFARKQGEKVPGRLVSSAKSWLCHPGVDRTAALLPWGAPDEVPRVSPLEASAKYLHHLVQAWNHKQGKAAEHRLEEQQIVLTVPASFDDTARQLTAEAARSVGFKHLTLLEEPQAAFYGWLGTHSGAEAGQLKPGMRCLVVDVGGGTTDFSLIRVGEELGDLTFQRDAVGDHLLLGGDNMDLALAKTIEAKAPSGKLDAASFLALVQACRAAKETLLGRSPPVEYLVTLMGRGRSVVSNTITVTVTETDVRSALLEGFFPFVAREATPSRAARTGLQELGLPYVADPAITRHLAAFLQEHLREPADTIDAILFNGGVFSAAALRERLLAVMAPWFSRTEAPWKPLVLTSPSLDLAVAWGAAYAGYLAAQGGRRIGGGIPRSYYLGVETNADATKPEIQSENQISVVCVVPRGLAEGHEVLIQKPEFLLALGEPVLFPVYASTMRGDDRAGDVLTLKHQQLAKLPPLCTVLRGGKRAGTKRVPVTLAAKCTEIGTMELFCVSSEGNRWKLEFNVRSSNESQADDDAALQTRAPEDIFPEEKIAAGSQLVHGCFSANVPTPAELIKELERVYEAPRNEWQMSLCRRLWDDIAAVAEERKRSPQHLSRWYNLAGFSLRPGFGDPLDRYRVDALWKRFATTASASASLLTKAPTTVEGGADYWIMWRRTAGGLNTALQQLLWGKLKNQLLPPKNKPAPRVPTNELAEMWRAVASLERLESRLKAMLGEELVRQILMGTIPHYAFWSLTRLGARQQLYGPLNTIVHPEIVERWVAKLLSVKLTNENERLGFAFCLAQLCRRTGLRGVDVAEETTEQVLARLKREAIPPEWLAMVETIQTQTQENQSRLFGESLPIGLRLPG